MSLRDSLEEGRGVHVKHFGAFAFEGLVSTVESGNNSKGSTVKLKPRFIPAPEFAAHLKKNQSVMEHLVDGSIYQQGLRMSYLNPVPIAKGAYFGPDFVASAIDVIFRAICDLLMRGYNLRLEFEGACTVSVVDRAIKISFAESLKPSIASIEKSYPLKSINASLSALTPSSTPDNISRVHTLIHTKRESRLSTLQRPNSSMLKDIKQRIERLNDSSKDLCNIHAN